MSLKEQTDIAIIGGGYYGAYAANIIKTYNPDLEVSILEKEEAPFTKASSTNQGQFHMGYMYSADRKLAAECVENIDKFSRDFSDAIDGEVTSLYGIHADSEISTDEYVAFCEDMKLPLQSIDKKDEIFGNAVVNSFKTAEKTFNSARLQELFIRKIACNGINLVNGFSVDRVEGNDSGIQLISNERTIRAGQVFNATFADINALHDRSGLPKIPLRYDTFLHFVLDLPEEYRTTAATVIRGAYASLMPSSYRNGHVLASGAHRKIQSTTMDKPSEAMKGQQAYDIYVKALAEASEYLPIVGFAKYRGFTVGTRAAHFEAETGDYTSKAIVSKDFGGLGGYHTIVGGKVSCMFDIAEPVKDALL